MPHRFPSIRPLAALGLALLVGCAPAATRLPSSATEAARTLPPASAPVVEARLLDAAGSWMDTPYRFGGTTRDGVDCSAFVRAVYADAFGLGLTRATKTQVHEGIPVGRDALRPGDLVFFRTGRDQRHVGIYLDGDRLLHASSSQNRVVVDDLDGEHFQRTYWTARRLLPLADDPPLASAPPFTPPQHAPEAVPAPASPARTGW